MLIQSIPFLFLFGYVICPASLSSRGFWWRLQNKINATYWKLPSFRRSRIINPGSVVGWCGIRHQKLQYLTTALKGERNIRVCFHESVEKYRLCKSSWNFTWWCSAVAAVLLAWSVMSPRDASNTSSSASGLEWIFWAALLPCRTS